MVRTKSWALLLSLFHLYICRTVAGSEGGDKFRTWYPEYRSIFNQILEKSCAEQYNAYLSDNTSFVGSEFIDDGANTPGEAVVQCILNSTSEFIKANMASAAVLLGIMPFALSVLGSDSEESSLLIVIARRPLLTFLILAGSPVVVALQPFEYKDPVRQILSSREPRFRSLNLGPSWFVLLLEYLIAFIACANTAHVTYQLCVSIVTVMWADSTILPALWVITGVLVHALGAWCLASRLSVEDSSGTQSLLQSEFCLSSSKTKKVKTIPERKLFLALSWIVSTSTTFHIIFGTLAFSSVQFISVKDAFGVIGRYTASVTICRMVVLYELSGLQQSTKEIQPTLADEVYYTSLDPEPPKTASVSPTVVQHTIPDGI
jgi:hypothetical protein